MASCGLLGIGCQLPDGGVQVSDGFNTVQSSDAIKSAEGARAYYDGVLAVYGMALYNVAMESGALTDELRPVFLIGQANPGQPTGIDARVVRDETGSTSFGKLQVVRANARLARAALAEYAPATSTAMIGHLYAVEGLTDVLLADLYCSGIPLSTVNPDGTLTLRAGSTTQEVYHTAIALFDSALARSVADTSAEAGRIRNFARVGKARALLALGHADSAAAAVSDVPTDYAYDVAGFMFPFFVYSGSYRDSFVMSDREGGTGLPYATSGDPRTAADTADDSYDGSNVQRFVFLRYFALKYAADGTTPMMVASGVEARLIEAEAQLRPAENPSGPWLQTLNALRASVGLADTTDPGTATGRVALLFHERAYWLFLTGHRQGDLRRLLRQYQALGFTQAQVYPSGAYPTGGTYGADVTLPVPAEEREKNPHYTGCYTREA